MTADHKLFAVYLGGRAIKGNTELHDVVFATGRDITETYEQLLDKWFGVPKGLHIDSWMELDVVDGYRVSLSDTPVQQEQKLWFVNLGAYREGEFTEVHANKFLVASSIAEAKTRAKNELLVGWPGRVHTDDLYEVDDCIPLENIDAFHVVLTPTDAPMNLVPNNAYYIIPKAVIADYITRKASAEIKEFRDAYGD